MRRVAFTSLLLFLTSCATSLPEPAHVAGVSSLEPVVEQTLALEPYQRLFYLQSQLGTPHSVQETPFRNLHNNRQVDTLRNVTYEGVELDTYHVSATGQEFLLQLTVSDEGFMSSFGVRIGSSHREVRALLGEPDWTEDQALVYAVGHETPDQLVIWFDGITVTKIAWQFYWS